MVSKLIKGDVIDFCIIGLINAALCAVLFTIFGLMRIFTRKKNSKVGYGVVKNEPLWVRDFRKIATKSQKSNFMIFLEFFNFFVSLGYMGIYIANTVGDPKSKISFYSFIPDLVMAFWFCISWTFKLLSSPRKFKFLFTPYTIIDTITISPVFISWITGRYAVLGFFRALRVWIFLNFLSKLPTFGGSKGTWISALTKKIDYRVFMVIAEIICAVINLLFMFSSLMHLFENNGDPWVDIENRVTQKLDFFECLYYAVTTGGTIGYGDISPKTTLGRLACVLFIITSIIVVPFEINKLIDLLNSIPEAFGHRITNFGSKRTILITGSITPNGLQNALHPIFFDSFEDMITPPRVCILQNKPISQDLKDVLSNPLISPNIHYMMGSAISRKTLIYLQIEKYDNVIILADRDIEDKLQEDSKNILKYWSIKNYCPDLKIYIQILTESMKKTIMNMPSPEYINIDNVVCIEELRCSFFAQNCVHAAISTVATNMIKPLLSENISKTARWEYDYTRGTSFNIYFQKFADHWVGMKFSQIASSFYNWKDDVIIYGLARRNLHKSPKIMLSPFDEEIRHGDIAIVLTDDKFKSFLVGRKYDELFSSFNEVPENFFGGKNPFDNKRVFHDDIAEKQDDIPLRENAEASSDKSNELNLPHKEQNPLRTSSKVEKKDYIVVDNKIEIENKKHDKLFEDFVGWPYVLKTKKDAKKHLTNHIIVCGNISKIFWFIATLRLNYLRDTKWYKKIVILDPDYLKNTNDPTHDLMVEKRAKKLEKFPDVYYYSGNPLFSEDLKAVNVKQAYKVVVFPTHNINKEESAAVNIERNLLDSDSMFISLNVSKESESETKLVMELSTDENMLFLDLQSQLKRIDEGYGGETNVDEVEGLMSPFFASGKVFSGAIFDFMVAQASFYPEMIPLVKHMVSVPGTKHGQDSSLLVLLPAFCGGVYHEPQAQKGRYGNNNVPQGEFREYNQNDQVIENNVHTDKDVDYNNIDQNDTSTKKNRDLNNNNRNLKNSNNFNSENLNEINLSSEDDNKKQNKKPSKKKAREETFYDFRKLTFREVFNIGLSKNILPFGIFRKPSEEFDIDKATHEYVITVPEPSTVIREDDQIYALVTRQVLDKVTKFEQLYKETTSNKDSEHLFIEENTEFLEIDNGKEDIIFN